MKFNHMYEKEFKETVLARGGEYGAIILLVGVLVYLFPDEGV